MATIYPAAIDNSVSLPDIVDNVSGINAASINTVKTAVVAVETVLGPVPQGLFTTVRKRIDAMEALIQSAIIGEITFSGDISGTVTHQTVIGLQTRPISSSAPAVGSLLWFDGAAWQYGVPAGDLSFSAPNVRVAKIQGNAVKNQTLGSSQDGYVLTWINANSDWEATPSSNAITLFGDVTGPGSSNIVVAWRNKQLDAATMGSPTDGYVPTWVAGSNAWKALPTTISSGGISPGTAGQVLITNGTPASTWTSLINVELTHGRFTAGRAGTDWSTTMGPFPGFETTNAGLWLLPNASSPNVNNYAIQSSVNGVGFNDQANTSMQFLLGGSTTLAYFTAANILFAGTSTSTAKAQIELVHGNLTAGGSGTDASTIIGTRVSGPTLPTIYLLNNGVAASTGNWAFQGDGTNLYHNTVGGTGTHFFYAGNTQVALIEGTHGRAQFGGIGSDFKAIVGPLVSFETADAGIWFLPAATAPTSANVALWCDGSNTFMNNGNASAVLGFIVAGSTYLGAFNGSQSRFYVGGSSAIAPLVVDWATSLQTQIGSGTSQTSLLIGNYNTGAASVIIQAGTGGISWRDGATQTTRGSIELVHGLATFGGSGSDKATSIGPDPAAPTTRSGVFFNATGSDAPTSIYSDQNSINFQALGGWLLQWGPGGLLQSTAGSLVVGTTVATRTITFQPDAAANLIQLAGGTQNTVPLGANIAAAGHIRTPSGWVWMSRRADNLADLVTFEDNGANSFFIGTSYSFVTIGNTSFTSEVDITTASIIAFETGGTIYSDATNFAWRDASHVSTMVWTLASGGATSGSVAEGVTSFTLGYTARTGDAATHDLKIQGQYAFATATLTNRTPGNIVFDIGAPTNGGTTEGAFKFTRNGSVIATLALDTSGQYGFWLGGSSILPSSAALISDASTFSYLNGGQTVGLLIADTTFMLYAPSTQTDVYFGGSAVTAPITFNWTTSTTPKIQSGTNGTLLTVGTNKAAATLTLQSDAAMTNLVLSKLSSTVSEVDFYAPDGTHKINVLVGNNGSMTIGTVTSGASFIVQADSASTVATLSKVSSTSSSIVFSSPGLASAATINVNDNGAAFFGSGALTTNYVLFNGTTANTYVVGVGGSHIFENNAAAVYATLAVTGSTIGTTTGTNTLTGALVATTRTQGASFTLDNTTTDKTVFITTTPTTVTLSAGAHTNGREVEFVVDTTATGSNGTDIALTIAPAATEKINGTNANWVITVPGSPKQVIRLKMYGNGTDVRIIG